jgi:mannitol/fructose-specific phosphotransferase system IIA component (Ntr-type)
MGLLPMLLVGAFILFGFLWYWFYARDKVSREYSLLHLVERVTGNKKTDYLLGEELREILIERDNVTEKRFEDLLRKCEIIDIQKYETPDKFARLIANRLSERLKIDKNKLYKILIKKEKDSNVMIHPGIAILSNIIDGRDKFEIIFVRCKKGIMLFDDVKPVHAFFVVVSTSEHQSFYMHSLMWIVQITEEIDFEKKWLDAKDENELREIILSSWSKRKIY